MERIRLAVVLAILGVVAVSSGAQSNRRPDIALTADRVFVIDSEVELADGFGASLDLYQFVGRSAVVLNAGLTYGLLSVPGITSINLAAPVFGLGLRAPVFRSGTFVVVASATAGGGPYVAALSDELLRPDGTPYDNQTGIAGMARGAGQVAVHVTPAFSVEVGADYAWYAGLAHSMRFRIGGSIAVEELGVPLELVGVQADELYPSLANRYASRSPVTVNVYNRSRFPVRDVRITASSDGLIAGEAAAAEIDVIESGATAETSLRFPLADAAIANSSERAVQIGLAAGGVVSNRDSAPRPLGAVETALLGRNSLTWTDDRKAASFVTPTSEAALRLSREVSSVVRGIDSTLDPMLRFAMAATEAMSVLGIEYAIDPNLPSFVAASANEQVVDYLQYPEDTLRFSSGDCDDLSILFASMLEAAGVPAAFITIPGHLFAAARLSMTPDQAAETFANESDYIVHEGNVWLPVETTIAGEGFVAAWKTGANQWNTASANDEAVLIPIADAWSVYPPASPQELEEERTLDAGRLESHLERELLRFVQLEFAPQIEALEARIAADRGTVRSYTNLGVLYAQAGLLEPAEAYFAQAIEIDRHPNALMNLGNIRRLQGRLEEALTLYREAELARPSSTELWLSISLTLRELGRDEESERYYARYAERRPANATAYSYLGTSDSGGRASLAAIEGSLLLWQNVEDDE